MLHVSNALKKRPSAPGRIRSKVAGAFFIDRRLHLENAYQRQIEADERLRSMATSLSSPGEVLEIENLCQMDQVDKESIENIAIRSVSACSFRSLIPPPFDF